MHVSFVIADEISEYIEFLVKLKIVASRSEFFRQSIQAHIITMMSFVEFIVNGNRDLKIILTKMQSKLKWKELHKPQDIPINILTCIKCNKIINNDESLIVHDGNLLHISCYKTMKKDCN